MIKKILDQPGDKVCPWLNKRTCTKSLICKRPCAGLKQWSRNNMIELTLKHDYSNEKEVKGMETREATREELLKAMDAPIVYKVAHIEDEAKGLYSSSFAGHCAAHMATSKTLTEPSKYFRFDKSGNDYDKAEYKVGSITFGTVKDPLFAYPQLSNAHCHFPSFRSFLPLAILECRVIHPGPSLDRPVSVLVTKVLERLPYEESPKPEPKWKVVPHSEMTLQFREPMSAKFPQDTWPTYVRIFHKEEYIAYIGMTGVKITNRGERLSYRVTVPSKVFPARFNIEHLEEIS